MSKKTEASYDAFEQLEIRIGKVTEVLPFPRARNPSYKVAVDFGPDFGLKWSSAQITRYEPQDLIGKTVVCVINFAPRNIAGFKSEVLIMGAHNEANEVVILTTESTVIPGASVF
jgi:tRNA-binding protein